MLKFFNRKFDYLKPFGFYLWFILYLHLHNILLCAQFNTSALRLVCMLDIVNIFRCTYCELIIYYVKVMEIFWIRIHLYSDKYNIQLNFNTQKEMDLNGKILLLVFKCSSLDEKHVNVIRYKYTHLSIGEKCSKNVYNVCWINQSGSLKKTFIINQITL